MPGLTLPTTAGAVAEWLGGRLVGLPPERPIVAMAPPDQAGPDTITMAAGPRYREQLDAAHPPAAVLVGEGGALPGFGCIEVADPRGAFDRLLEAFAPPPWQPEEGVHPTAVLGPGCRIGHGVRIGPWVVLGRRVEVGDGCVLYPGVVVGDDVQIGEHSVLHARVVVRERVRIGRRVILHPGVVIGADGFGYRTRGGEHHKVPQIGTVVVEDDVEIGANAAVDRATCGATVIGRGTKIDNLVQVAHNVRVGSYCLLAGQVGIAGSTRLGHGVMMGGQAGVIDHIDVGDHAVVAARGMVIADVPPGARVAGEPAVGHGQALRIWSVLRRLPELAARVRALEAAVRALQGEAHGEKGAGR